MAADVNVLNN